MTGAGTPPDLATASRDGSLRVEFCWAGDRYRHRLLLDDRVVAESVEGDAATAWPVSPPVQQLSGEPIDGHWALLGIGAAGRGHWSVSVDSPPGRPASIRFDVACRSGATPGFLGSTYAAANLDDLRGRLRIEIGTRQMVHRRLVCQPEKAGQTTRWTYEVRGRLGG